MCRWCVGVGVVAVDRWVTIGIVPVVWWGGNASLLPVYRDEEWGLELALWAERNPPCRYARKDTQVSDFFVIVNDVGTLC